jgi:hypothetical protein
LIPLVRQELGVLQTLINAEDPQLSQDAMDISALYRLTATKLKEDYESQWWEGSDFPAYEALIREL